MQLTSRGPVAGEHADGVVIVLPGGKPQSIQNSEAWRLSNVRMWPFAQTLHATLPTVAVHRVRYRTRGWNAPDLCAVADAQTALEVATNTHPGAPVVLMGHSMGGRVAAHVAVHPAVSGVVALAPWWPEQDADLIPRGRGLLVLHGEQDRWTSADAARQGVEAAQLRGVDAEFRSVPGSGHFMLRHPGRWHKAAAEGVSQLLRARRGAR